MKVVQERGKGFKEKVQVLAISYIAIKHKYKLYLCIYHVKGPFSK